MDFQICDGISCPTLLAVAGNVLVIITLLLIGPVPFLDGMLVISLNYECGMVVVFGVGYSLIMVSAVGRAIKEITNRGYCMDTSTTMLITGMSVLPNLMHRYALCYIPCEFNSDVIIS